jgi:hypothetical protein
MSENKPPEWVRNKEFQLVTTKSQNDIGYLAIKEKPISLPHVTMVCIDTVNYGDAIHAIQKSLEQVTPARTIFFTDIDIKRDMPFDVVRIPRITSKRVYSEWMIKELGKQQIDTSHVLVIQADGYVLDGSQWKDEFLQYDYVGASWLETDDYNVGNGGFSLRSWKLCQTLSSDDFIRAIHPEDGICKIYRDYLEKEYSFKWPTEELADLFSFELRQPAQPTFGFHGRFHPPYNYPIVIKRTGALGDVISLEPVMRYFHERGHLVVLDSQFYLPFARHYFPVMEYSKFDHQRIQHRTINFDHSYEIIPDQLHLKSYFEMAGINDYELTKPRLHYPNKEGTRLFKDEFIVVHIDERETSHRDIHGVDWNEVEQHLISLGYLVIQIGRNSSVKIGVQFNTANEALMMWLISSCDLFIGIDSGPSHIAVALDKKCVLAFGSVNPEFIHPDLTNIIALQSSCPAKTPNCWHSVKGATRGPDCTVDVETPPCTVLSSQNFIDAINKMLLP